MIGQLQRLKTQRDAAPSQLVFPNTKGKPDSLHIEIVKRVAHRAKLNCGQCVTKHGNKCADGPYCQRFFLHKFRHTFATEHLRHGVDIRTLQNWMGHRDIHSTMVYLKGIQSKDACSEGQRRLLGLVYRLTQLASNVGLNSWGSLESSARTPIDRFFNPVEYMRTTGFEMQPCAFYHFQCNRE